jgi:hypothetical protein
MKTEELRTLADQASSARMRDTFRDLADTYDRLANDGARRANHDEQRRPKNGDASA